MMTEQQKDHLETLPDRVRIRRLEISHQAGFECRIESDEQIEKLKKQIRKLGKDAGKSKVAKTDIRAGKIEQFLERCHSARTDWEKDSKRVGAYGQEPLNDFDYGECKGWINAMEFVIFDLELIMKEGK